MRRRTIGVAGTIGLAAGLAGCSVDNDRLSLGLPDAPVYTPPAIAPGPALEPATEPSVTGVGREHWAKSEFVVPNDGVMHWPHVTEVSPALDRGTARARGEYPTAITALEQEGDLGMIVLDVWAGPIVVAGDAILLIPRLVDPPPASPSKAYDRAGE